MSGSVTLVLTPETFRQLRPEFGDKSAFPDPIVNRWLTVATTMLNASRWGTLLSVGCELYVAHQLALQRRRTLTALAQGIPGEASGVVASKAVGGLQKSFDTTVSSEVGAGFWNQTDYGREFYHYVTLVGAGGDLDGSPDLLGSVYVSSSAGGIGLII